MNLRTKEDYAEAKKLLKELTWKRDNMRGSDSFTQHMKMHVSLLEAVLLAYRRQHNIFEVGDKVVHDAHIGDEIYEFVSLLEDIGMATVKSKHMTGGCSLRGLRYATPEEIKAGRRL